MTTRRTFGQFLQGRLLCQTLADVLPEYSARHLEAALNGDPEEASALVVGAPNSWRGDVAVAMYLIAAPLPAMRAALSVAWMHDHRHVIHAARNVQRLRAMFRYAAFPLPGAIPDVVDVWRGTSSLSREKAERGYSWTLDRDTACWFAMRFADGNGNPLVLKRTVRKEDILFYTEDRAETEAVILQAGPYAVDGDPADWQHGFERYNQAKRVGACLSAV